jgi:hypothetical protein
LATSGDFTTFPGYHAEYCERSAGSGAFGNNLQASSCSDY